MCSIRCYYMCFIVKCMYNDELLCSNLKIKNIYLTNPHLRSSELIDMCPICADLRNLSTCVQYVPIFGTHRRVSNMCRSPELIDMCPICADLRNSSTCVQYMPIFATYRHVSNMCRSSELIDYIRQLQRPFRYYYCVGIFSEFYLE